MKTLTQKLALAAMLLITGTATAQTASQVIKLYMTENANMPSQAPALLTLKFTNGGNDSLQFPDQGDVASLGQFSDEVFPFSVTTDSAVITGYDCRSLVTSYREIRVGFGCKNPGDIKVFATTSTSDPAIAAPAYVWLEQISTGERYNVLDTAKFSIAGNPDFESDFIMHIGPPCATYSTPETCYGYANGTIHAAGPNYPNFNYELWMGNSQIVNTTVAGYDTTITGLSGGNYVSVIRINGIPVDSSDILVGGATPIVADFLTDYNFIAAGDTVNFTDMSAGGVNYTWDFGDGDTSYVAGSESHSYASIGSYQVTLTISDGNGCESSTYDFITVQSPALMNNSLNNSTASNFNTGDRNNSTSSAIAINSGTDVYASGQRLIVAVQQETSSITVVAANGALVYSGVQTESRAEYNLPAAGVYVVTITYANGTAESKTILAQ